ncbi:MAG TPA: hypothetical protein VN282_16745 [Pyrinomonadaceae bacterium]|nr:hypothetical protein [Pyrinomonadaceae bacterium]
MRTRGSHLLILLLVLAASAAGVTLLLAKRSRPRVVSPVAAATPDAPPAKRTLPPLPLRALSPRLKSLRERAAQSASRVRGLEWRGEVGMTELSGWEYGTRTKEIADVLGTDDLKGLSRLAVAGGMLPEGTDLASLAVSFTAVTAGATYSPLDKQVLLVSERGAARDPGLLTHEFVHALQDQHFDLLRMVLARPFSFDREEAAFALIEGDAVSVERRFTQGEAWARKSVEVLTREEDERYAQYRKGIGAFFPPLLTETFIFRYRDGLHFVETLRRVRPAVNLDEVFRRPPQSSEQVLHPEKYLSGEPPREVEFDLDAFADEGWRPAATTPLGEIGVRGLLLAGVSVEEAKRAAAGWGGDRSFVFEREGHAPLFVWRTAWDTPRDAQEFFRAYNQLLQQRAAPGAAKSESEREWREGASVTRVRLEGDWVIVVRGAEADADEALRLSSGR